MWCYELFSCPTSSLWRSLGLKPAVGQLHGNWQLALAKLRTFGHMVNVVHDKISQIYEVLQPIPVSGQAGPKVHLRKTTPKEEEKELH